MSRANATTKGLPAPMRSIMENPMTCPLGKVAQRAASCHLAEELDPDASIHLARNLLLSELPGVAFGVITLVYIVTRLVELM